MYSVNDSIILQRPVDIPGALANKIDEFIRKENPNAPAVGRYYVDLGNIFKILPEFAAAQAIVETGYFRFGGEVSPEWYNPAGLQCAGSYLRFASWEQGIHAQYERLNSYIREKDTTGRGGRYDTCYSHTRYWTLKSRGLVPDRISSIATLWQTGSAEQYANNIVRIMNAITQTEPAEPPAQPGQPGILTDIFSQFVTIGYVHVMVGLGLFQLGIWLLKKD